MLQEGAKLIIHSIYCRLLRANTFYPSDHLCGPKNLCLGPLCAAPLLSAGDAGFTYATFTCIARIPFYVAFALACRSRALSDLPSLSSTSSRSPVDKSSRLSPRSSFPLELHSLRHKLWAGHCSANTTALPHRVALDLVSPSHCTRLKVEIIVSLALLHFFQPQHHSLPADRTTPHCIPTKTLHNASRSSSSRRLIVPLIVLVSMDAPCLFALSAFPPNKRPRRH